MYTYTNNKLINVIQLKKKKEVTEMKRRAAVSNLRNEGLWWNMVYTGPRITTKGHEFEAPKQGMGMVLGGVSEVPDENMTG